MKYSIYFAVFIALISCEQEHFIETNGDIERNIIPYNDPRVIFQPNGTIGKDASLLNGNGSLTVLSNTNTPDRTHFCTELWTAIGIGASEVGSRVIIEFTELDTFSKITEIENAILTLYEPNDDTIINTLSSGGQFGHRNDIVIQNITEEWYEDSVTWNNQPNVFSFPKVIGAENNIVDSTVLNVTTLLEDQINRNAFHGFLIQLQYPTDFRNRCFYSSDYYEPSLRPKLTLYLTE